MQPCINKRLALIVVLRLIVGLGFLFVVVSGRAGVTSDRRQRCDCVRGAVRWGARGPLGSDQYLKSDQYLNSDRPV